MKRLILTAMLAGCAAGGDPGDGGSALPDRGFAGYVRLVDAEGDPMAPIARPEGVELRDPMARVVGGRVELYVSRCEGMVPCAIARAVGDGVIFGDLEVVAEHPDGLSDPFATDDGIYAIAGDGFGLVRIADGVAHAIAPTGGMTPTIASPSVVEADDGRFVYLAVGADPTRLGRARLDGDAMGPIELIDVPGVDEGWVAPSIDDPEVRRATTGAGRTVYRLIHAGRPGGADADVAFAAAFDGLDFAPYPFNPALAGDDDESSPSNIRLGSRYLIYFQRPSGRLGMAERVADNPTESF